MSAVSSPTHGFPDQSMGSDVTPRFHLSSRIKISANLIFASLWNLAGLDDPAWGGLHIVASLCRSAIALVVERVRTQPCGGNYGQGWMIPPGAGSTLWLRFVGALSRGWSNIVRTQPCGGKNGQGWMIPLGAGSTWWLRFVGALSRWWSNEFEPSPAEGIMGRAG